MFCSISVFIVSMHSFYSFENRGKSTFHTFLAFGVCCHLVLNAVFSVFLLCIAGTNYPGGVAISRLHGLAKDEEFVFVHIDVLTAQTGVSRFTQDNPNWRYQKLWNLVMQHHLVNTSSICLTFEILMQQNIF